jgi:Flp pilus assembly protein TadD
MNLEHNIEEIRRLKKLLAQNRQDTDIMNKLAIAYLDNDEAFYISKALLKKAYKLNPSIKTANNYACLLIVQDWFYEEGIEIRQLFFPSEN